MKRTVLACLLLAAVAGCSDYTRVKAFVEPEGRTVGFVPFRGDKAKSITVSDRNDLATMAADAFRTALPKERALGPSDMHEALSKGMNEARWHDIGSDTGAELLVIGEIMSLEAWHDELLGTREGAIRLRLRVLDVSAFPPKVMAKVRGAALRFPAGLEAKFDEEYVNMDQKTFRKEMLRYAAGYVAGMFYEHYVRKDTVIRSDVTVRKQ